MKLIATEFLKTSEMKMILSFAFIFLALQASPSSGKWWEHTAVYQIYPRSFQDSNDDGTGDLTGITSRLDHLVDIGVETFWLSPIYKSPMADFGYDISDYVDVDPIFGTIEDFDTLSVEAKKRNLRIVMDFVPNHSSNEHEWFLKSEQKEEPYTDYYIWKDRNESNPGGVPNNWLGVFRGSAWEWSETRKQFYYHAFTKEQPDLNYWNTAIKQEMKDILKFWTDKGVDGFRMDAVPFLFEDQEFKDEPLSGKTDDPEDYNYLNHIYTWNFPEVIDVLAEFTESVRENTNGEGFVMVEALSEDLTTENMMTFYNCSDFAFNFNMIVKLKPDELSGDTIKAAVADWLDNMPEGKTANWVLGNHDNWRVGSRFGEGNMDGFNMISLLLPGVAVTYNGEEIGMTNTDVSWEQTVDPAGLNCGEEHFQDMGCSRDPERTPMQWDTSENAGFSPATPWLPVNQNYLDGVNVEAQSGEGESHLSVYKQLTTLRKNEPVFKNGNTDMISTVPVFAFARHDQQVAYFTVVNVMGEEARIDLTELIDLVQLTETMGVVEIRSSGVTNDATNIGSNVDLKNIVLIGYEAIVIRVGQETTTAEPTKTTSGSTCFDRNILAYLFMHIGILLLCWLK